MPQAMLRNFLSLSVLFHAGLFGFLLLFGQHAPYFSDRPMRIRLIEPPGVPAAPAPGPPAAPAPGPRSVPAPSAEKAPGRTPPPPAPPPREAGRGIRTVPDVERPAPAAPAPAQTPAPLPAATPEGRAAGAEPRAEKAEVKAPAPEPRAGTSEQPRAEGRGPSAETREAPENRIPPVTSGESAPASKAPPQVASVPVLPPVELPRTPSPQPSPETPRPAAPDASREGSRTIVPEAPRQAPRSTIPDASREIPRPTIPDASREIPRSAGPDAPREAPRSARPEPPQVASRPTAPDASPAAPPRGGLSLGGGSQELRPPPPAAGGATQPARPSLRDQIASLGSGRWAEGQGSGKQTVDLDNREERFVDYLALLKRRIERVWQYPPEAANNGISGALLLVFTLNKSGTLIDLRLIQSSGFPVLDEEAIRAIKQAAPYDPFPRHMGDDPWNIRASFHYNLPYRFRRN